MDQEWAIIGLLLPPERGRWARPAGNNRLFLNGMLHVVANLNTCVLLIEPKLRTH